MITTHRSRPAHRLASACLLALAAGLAFPTHASEWNQAQGALAEPDDRAALGHLRRAAAAGDTRAEIGHLRATYPRVARLADDGDAEAARLALRMRHVVPKLSDGSMQVSREQLRRWAGVVAQDDSANCDQPSAETLQLLQG